MREGGQQVQTSSIKQRSHGDVMDSTVTAVNTILCISELLREKILKVLITGRKVFCVVINVN